MLHVKRKLDYEAELVPCGDIIDRLAQPASDGLTLPACMFGPLLAFCDVHSLMNLRIVNKALSLAAFEVLSANHSLSLSAPTLLPVRSVNAIAVRCLIDHVYPLPKTVRTLHVICEEMRFFGQVPDQIADLRVASPIRLFRVNDVPNTNVFDFSNLSICLQRLLVDTETLTSWDLRTSRLTHFTVLSRSTHFVPKNHSWGFLPDTLTHLSVWSLGHETRFQNLPPNLQHLAFAGGRFEGSDLPRSLEDLVIDARWDTLDSSLLDLARLAKLHTLRLSISTSFHEINLPPSIRHVLIGPPPPLMLLTPRIYPLVLLLNGPLHHVVYSARVGENPETYTPRFEYRNHHVARVSKVIHPGEMRPFVINSTFLRQMVRAGHDKLPSSFIGKRFRPTQFLHDL